MAEDSLFSLCGLILQVTPVDRGCSRRVADVSSAAKPRSFVVPDVGFFPGLSNSQPPTLAMNSVRFANLPDWFSFKAPREADAATISNCFGVCLHARRMRIAGGLSMIGAPGRETPAAPPVPVPGCLSIAESGYFASTSPNVRRRCCCFRRRDCHLWAAGANLAILLMRGVA